MPSIPYNICNWQVFENDKDLLKFSTCQENYQDIEIDWNELVEIQDGKDTILGEEIVQLKSNIILK